MRPHARPSRQFAMAAMAAVLAMLAAGTATAATADTTTPAPTGHSAVAQIEQVERDWLAALRNDDRAALERILADDFTDISVHGEVRHKAEAVAHRVAPGTVQHVHDLQVRVYDDTAVATGINTVHSPVQGWNVDVVFTDVFVRRHGRWQAVSAQETLRNGGSR